MITLSALLAIIPDHARIGIVEKHFKNNNEYHHTIYSGYKKDYLKFFNQACIIPYSYEVYSIHAGSWDNKLGLCIGVKKIENEK